MPYAPNLIRYSEVHNYNFSDPKVPRNASYNYGMTGHFTQGAACRGGFELGNVPEAPARRLLSVLRGSSSVFVGYPHNCHPLARAAPAASGAGKLHCMMRACLGRRPALGSIPT